MVVMSSTATSSSLCRPFIAGDCMRNRPGSAPVVWSGGHPAARRPAHLLAGRQERRVSVEEAALPAEEVFLAVEDAAPEVRSRLAVEPRLEGSRQLAVGRELD